MQMKRQQPKEHPWVTLRPDSISGYLICLCLKDRNATGWWGFKSSKKNTRFSLAYFVNPPRGKRDFKGLLKMHKKGITFQDHGAWTSGIFYSTAVTPTQSQKWLKTCWSLRIHAYFSDGLHWRFPKESMLHSHKTPVLHVNTVSSGTHTRPFDNLSSTMNVLQLLMKLVWLVAE